MKNITKLKRKLRIRAKIRKNTSRPRLAIFRSNKYIYAQIIDDQKGQTLIGVSEVNLSLKYKVSKTDKSKQLGLLIAKKATEKKINKVVFDKGQYKYHGRIKAVADGAREGGLKF